MMLFVINAHCRFCTVGVESVKKPEVCKQVDTQTQIKGVNSCEAALQHVLQCCDLLPELLPHNNGGNAETKQHDLLMTSFIEKLLEQTELFDVAQQNGLLVCDWERGHVY